MAAGKRNYGVSSALAVVQNGPILYNTLRLARRIIAPAARSVLVFCRLEGPCLAGRTTPRGTPAAAPSTANSSERRRQWRSLRAAQYRRRAEGQLPHLRH